MIITRLLIDNLYSFQNFELDLTYPKKNSQSFIDFEFLEDVPVFKFKRICILMGTNASGKTSLGKVLWAIQVMLTPKTYFHVPPWIIDAIHDKEQPAHLSVEFVFPSSKVFGRFSMTLLSNGYIQDILYSTIELNKSDSNITATTRLNNQINIDKSNQDLFNPIEHENEKINSSFKDSSTIGYYYVLAENHTNDIQQMRINNDKDLAILLNILRTFDSSISDVNFLKTIKQNAEVIEGYTVSFENGDSIKVTDNGKTFTEKDKNRISKGTYDVLSIVDFILTIMKNTKSSATYFLDEKLASSHSELEITILNLIIQKLNPYSQFFYTTHNYDVLDLNLPSHSFAFLHKENGYSSVEQPEKCGFSKNDRTLKGHVRNNYFKTIPSTHLLDDLMWGE